ncbi:MAG: DMT family transporter [Pararhodobacter sp.]|nr:DMT family transporter [Pararhodobacter sp.]MCC5972411.1 DMT family transporter [Pararhodobacter sp.]
MPAPAIFAALSMVVATAFFASTTLLAKALGSGALGEPVHALQISHARFVFGCLAVLIVVALLPRRAVAQNARNGAPQWGLHLARTVLGWLGGALLFAAAAQMALTDANALSFLSPVATMLFAIPLLGEKVGRWRWTAAGLAMLGALVLLRPGAGVIQPAALLALGAALAFGLEGIFIKKLTNREAPRQILVVNNLIGVAIATLAVIAVFQMPVGVGQWAALAGVGVLMVAGQVLFLLAVARADASYVAPFFYLVLVWAALFDIAVFGVWPDWVTVSGGAIVVSGGLIMAWREARLRTVPPTP